MMAALALIGLGLPIGFLIGLIGIGGVLLAPALVHLFGRDIHDAVSLSLASFVLAGAIAAMRAGSSDVRLNAGDWIFLGTIIPGAFIGALAAPWIPATSLSLIVSACVALAGLSCLRKPAGNGGVVLKPGVLASAGVATGFLSAMSGTGGPLICLPLLLWKGMDVRRALLLAQVAQLPVAGTATVVNGIRGSVDYVVVGILSVAIVAGMLTGIAVSRRIETGILRTSVACCLIVVGIALCAADLWRIAGP
ncbi:MAG: sulfite exporter TauE/SafE family protein [Pseudolabrys sp.]